MKLTLKHPLEQFVISQPFGNVLMQDGINVYQTQLGDIGHPGIDMVGTTGQPFYAAHDGVVIAVEQDGRGGIGVVLRTENTFDFDGQELYAKTLYWHAQTGSIVVKTGDKVTAGQHLGNCDSTGVRIGQILAKDSHLHFGLIPSKFNPGAPPGYGAYYEAFDYNNGYHGCVDPAPYFEAPLNNAISPPGYPTLAEQAVVQAKEILQGITKSAEPVSIKQEFLDELLKVVELIKNLL